MNEEEISENWLNMRQQQPIQQAIQDAYWQHYRVQAAIAALNGITSSGSFEQHTLEDVIAECMKLADALIAELQKKGGQDDNNH